MAKKRTGLMKKYIKLAGGSFKKAWKLQKAATKKKTGKKVSKKKVSRKRVAKKNPVKKVNPKPKRKAAKMPKKKRSYKKKRRRGNPGNPGGRGKMTDVLIQGAAGIGGAIGAGVVANMIPIKDLRIKSLIPIAAAVLLASTKMGRTKMMQGVITGMTVAGGLSLVRQFVPNLPLLAGEEDDLLDYIPPEDEEAAMLGYTDDLDEDFGQDDLDELSELDGEAMEVGGEEDEFLTQADM